MPTTIAVIGTGYVGLTTGACLASLGHDVTCADIDPAKIERLRAADPPQREPDLPDLVRAGTTSGSLRFALGARAAVSDETELVFLCLPTPTSPDGGADLTAVDSVVTELADVLPTGCVVVTKSTVPVGTTARIGRRLGRSAVSNPEFLREGSAVHDFLSPDRIVIGARDDAAADRVAAVYAQLHAPVVRTDPASAELVKYAANGFLALRLSYVNVVAELCEHLGADIADVAEGVGLDHRIGRAFLRPGPGWGGSCLPKDVRALLHVAETEGADDRLFRATLTTNARQHQRVVDKVRRVAGRPLEGARIGLLGLTFKAGTDDLRASPALEVARLLAAEGAELTAHDPAVSDVSTADSLRITEDPYETAKGAAALVVLTEWPEYRELDWSRMAGQADGRAVVDTRNLLDPDVLRRAGLDWHGTGRAAVTCA